MGRTGAQAERPRVATGGEAPTDEPGHPFV